MAVAANLQSLQHLDMMRYYETGGRIVAPSRLKWPSSSKLQQRRALLHVTKLAETQAVEQRAMAAKARAEQAERRVETLLQQLNGPPKLERKPPVSFWTVSELRDPSGICRVCGKKAPPPSAARRDDLRVCVAEACRVEARRRHDAAKQRRYSARWKVMDED